ncbi:hypothetical protein EF767_23475, partial [Escherichia coli]|nr:hypothetical protein [Escherichia coli]
VYLKLSLFSDTVADLQPNSGEAINPSKQRIISTLPNYFLYWHSYCIIVTSGSFTDLCQPLRDVLHKIRMTHNKVPAVQLLISA